MIQLDWQGSFVNDETPDTIINVWVITPGSGGHDETWIRDYDRAVEFATERLEAVVDQATKADLLEHGVEVKMRLRAMRLGDYLAVVNGEAE